MIKKEVLEKVCENIFEEKPPVLQTGFKDLDNILSGVENSSLITIGARPAMHVLRELIKKLCQQVLLLVLIIQDMLMI